MRTCPILYGYPHKTTDCTRLTQKSRVNLCNLVVKILKITTYPSMYFHESKLSYRDSDTAAKNNSPRSCDPVTRVILLRGLTSISAAVRSHRCDYTPDADLRSHPSRHRSGSRHRSSALSIVQFRKHCRSHVRTDILQGMWMIGWTG